MSIKPRTLKGRIITFGLILLAASSLFLLIFIGEEIGARIQKLECKRVIMIDEKYSRR